MASTGNPFLNNPTCVKKKRWSKLQELNPASNEDSSRNNCELNIGKRGRFETVNTIEKIDERVNTFTTGEKREKIYSSFISFTKKPEIPPKKFDMEQMTDDALNDEFPYLC